MATVLLKAASFVFIIAFGYALKCFGFFREGDHRFISKIILNITLPASIICGMCGFESDNRLFWLILLGLGCSVIPLLIGYAITARLKDDKPLRALTMINVAGYNIGCFALPFVQTFFGTEATVFICLFDIGNSMMMTAGSYAITSTMLHTGDGERLSVGGFVKKFVSSTSFDVYMIVMALCLLKIQIPAVVGDFLRPCANANAFLAMLMLGTMLRIERAPEKLKAVGKILSLRYAMDVLMAALMYFCTPFPLAVRQVLAVLAFAPIGALAPVFTERCNGDGSLSSFACSISIFISVIIIVALVLVMGVGA